MAIRSIELQEFTAFQAATLELSPGVNVLVGRNGTGKTHVMKALYAVVRGRAEGPGAHVITKLVRVMRPDDDATERLIRRGPTLARASIAVRAAGADSFRVNLGGEVPSEGTTEAVDFKKPPPTVFVPSREALAMFEGFAATYQKRELSFDETYYDLAMSLSVPVLRATPSPATKKIKAALEEALGGKVVLEGRRFYVQAAGGSMLEAHLVSEGMRKLGSILRLVQNGEIRPGGLLLWDEPEANLNPHLTVLVARVLARLAANDVQIVIATHDYLLTETLALLQREGDPRFGLRYFALRREPSDAGVSVSARDELGELPFNPIRDEFLAHYDRVRGIED